MPGTALSTEGIQASLLNTHMGLSLCPFWSIAGASQVAYSREEFSTLGFSVRTASADAPRGVLEPNVLSAPTPSCSAPSYVPLTVS